MNFVDTNYFIRFFLNDIPTQSLKVKKIFDKASEGKILLFSSTVVFFEICWVFLRYYKKTKPEVVEILRKVLGFKFIYFDEKDVLTSSLIIFKKTSLELEDCYNIAYAKVNGMKEFKTFDMKLNRYLNKKSK